MKVSELLTPSRILLRDTASNKEAILNRLLEILNQNGDIENLEETRSVIFNREQLMSTGIGHGVALPHGKTNFVRGTSAAMITLQQPVEYDSLDGQPVSIAIMLIGKEQSVSSHLKLLSKISRIIIGPGFHSTAMSSANSEELHKYLAQFDDV